MVHHCLLVPKLKQKPLYCVPACASMVFAYYKLNIPQEEIVQHLTPSEQGFYISDLIYYARSFQFISRSYRSGTIDQLIHFIDHSIPPIVRVKSLDDYTTPHALVIRGYDLNKKEFLVNDPEDIRRSHISIKAFSNIWTIDSKTDKSENYLITIRKNKK